MNPRERYVVVRDGRRICKLHDEPLVRVTIPLDYGHPHLVPGDFERMQFLSEHAPHSLQRALGAGPDPKGKQPTTEVEHCAECVRIRDANPVERFAPAEAGKPVGTSEPEFAADASGPFTLPVSRTAKGRSFRLPCQWIPLVVVALAAYVLWRWLR